MLTLLIVIAGVGVTAFVAGIAALVVSPEADHVEGRLEALTSGSRKLGIGSVADTDLLAGTMEDVPGMLEAALMRFFNLRLMIEQADVNITVAKFLGICAGVGGTAAIAVAMGLNYALAPVAFAVFAPLPLLWLMMARKKRQKAFATQLPDALELMARGLRAGHSLAAGFQLVGEEMREPIGPEFTRVFEEQNLGVPLEEAMQTMTNRIPNLDLKFFATAVVLQRQTGGDLAEILDKIGHLVRERFKIFGQIQALTGEGRLSGIVLLALPPVLFLVMLKLNFDYSMTLFRDELGRKMMLFAVVTQVIGALVIKKIVNIKV